MAFGRGALDGGQTKHPGIFPIAAPDPRFMGCLRLSDTAGEPVGSVAMSGVRREERHEQIEP
jgi:hypothetical protein